MLSNWRPRIPIEHARDLLTRRDSLLLAARFWTCAQKAQRASVCKAWCAWLSQAAQYEWTQRLLQIAYSGQDLAFVMQLQRTPSLVRIHQFGLEHVLSSLLRPTREPDVLATWRALATWIDAHCGFCGTDQVDNRTATLVDRSSATSVVPMCDDDEGHRATLTSHVCGACESKWLVEEEEHSARKHPSWAVPYQRYWKPRASPRKVHATFLELGRVCYEPPIRLVHRDRLLLGSKDIDDKVPPKRLQKRQAKRDRDAAVSDIVRAARWAAAIVVE